MAEEFVGPFSSWANVKTDYGAVGNGSTDDTAAIQDALDDLGTGSFPFVLWFPAGTYRITSMLSMSSRIHVSLIGADPATTAIVWDGAANGTMLFLDGVAYSRFNRLTWDGNVVASIAIDQSKQDSPTVYFDTVNEYADNRFLDVGFGIHGGFGGFGFAETVVKRCTFTNCTQAAIALGNQNALDCFVHQCTFTTCNIGVSNNTPEGVGAGDFCIYDCFFDRSTLWDIVIGHTESFSIRNNYSTGSGGFCGAGYTENSAQVIIQGNTILDTTSWVIYWTNFGPLLLIDNVMRARVGSGAGVDPMIAIGTDRWCDLFTIGNTFGTTATDPINSGSTRRHSIDDVVVNRSTINPTPPTMPGAPVNNSRTIYEAGASATTMQAAIASAVANGSRSVVHIGRVGFNVDTALTIPANIDIQVIGDGGNSKLTWTGVGTGPLLTLTGPSKAILRDFQVGGASTGNGIKATNCDQAGSRVFIEQAHLESQNNVYVNGLDRTLVQLQELYHTAATGISLRIVGGAQAAAGNWLGGLTAALAGVSANNALSYHISNGAHATIRDIWFEGSASSGFFYATGIGVCTFEGGRVATTQDFDLENWRGIAALLTTYTNGQITIHGNGSGGKVLTVGMVGPDYPSYITDTTSPADTLLSLNGQVIPSEIPGTGASPVAEIGTYAEQMVRDGLAATRVLIAPGLDDLASGITDVRMHRVFVTACVTGIELVADPVASGRLWLRH